jgi:hypothetical protein
MVVMIPEEVRPTSHLQRRRCGKPFCQRGKIGPGHGPSWYASWRTGDGKLRGRSVGQVLPPDVLLSPRQQQCWRELLALRAGQTERS